MELPPYFFDVMNVCKSCYFTVLQTLFDHCVQDFCPSIMRTPRTL